MWREFDYYLEKDVIPRSPDIDILQWWRTDGIKYATKQKIAKDIFAILVSTVASESTVSICGQLLSPYCRSLHPNMVEALTCAQDWLVNQLEGKLKFFNFL